jgi:hypothetical protein
MAGKTRKRRSTFSFKDVEILYLVEGLSRSSSSIKRKKFHLPLLDERLGLLKVLAKSNQV